MFVEDHILLSLIGDAWTGVETWTYGFRLRKPDGLDDPAQWDLDGLCAAVAPLATTMHQSAGADHPGHVRLQRIKAAPINKDTGKYFDGLDAGEYVYPVPVTGTVESNYVGGTQYAIPQATVAVTLLADQSRGYATKGRFFPPTSVRWMSGDGTFPAAQATALATAVKTFINGVNALNQAGLVTIESKGKGTKTVDADGKVHWTYTQGGASRPVTRVRVGRVVDTQRRRRRSIAEAPVLVSL